VSYCDDHCDLPVADVTLPHTHALCYGQFSGQVWRDATDKEIALFDKEIAEARSDGGDDC
jgi:hypothetical protein